MPSIRAVAPLAQLAPRTLVILACGAIALACAPESPAYRGAGLQPATLRANDVVAIYRAAAGSAFDLNDPALSLLVDPVLLPRTKGLAGGDPMPAAVRAELQRRRIVKGTCSLQTEKTRTPLVCRAARPGYVVRFSEPLALGAGRDSVQVHLVAQQYAIPRGPVEVRLVFERAYHVARTGSSWRAVGEARLPQP